jgi:pyrroline-5-carboxylate reductase
MNTNKKNVIHIPVPTSAVRSNGSKDSRSQNHQRQCIGFLGGGNMTTAILQGLLHRDDINYVIVEPDVEAQKRLFSLMKNQVIRVIEKPNEALGDCSLIVLATKPQHLKKAFLDALAWLKTPLVISIAAGITTNAIAKWWSTFHDTQLEVVRTMPNTPALVGQGMTALYATETVSEKSRVAATKLMGVVGKTVWLSQEHLIDGMTAISGSGPAYFFWLMDEMVKSAVSFGFTADQARAIVVQNALGAAYLSAKSTDTLQTLKEKVTSKGGTTAAALGVLADQHVEDIFSQALLAAKNRAKELADLADKADLSEQG